jgi:hypothetical protein
MRAIERVVVAAVASMCCSVHAMAAQLTGAEIRELISGNSVYLQLTASITGVQGQGVIYYDTLGTALFIWHGTWKIEGNTACIDWKESPIIPAQSMTSRATRSRLSTSPQA